MFSRVLSFIILSCVVLVTYATENYTIGVKEDKPFSYKENGEWDGYSIDLVKELSKLYGFSYSFAEFNDTPTLIKDVQNQKVDFSIAAISTTAPREKVIDFSHPYFSTTLGVLVRNKTPITENIMWIISKVGGILIGFVIFIYIIGAIADKVDGDENIRNPHEGAWWALVTFTTTGYGDLVPKTPKGKIFAAVWMVASLSLLSTFTGYLASAMTVKSLTGTPMTIGDLYRTKIVTIKGTTSQDALNDLGIKYNVALNLDEAMKMLATKQVAAILYDKAILDYVSRDIDGYAVWSIEYGHENYAIAFPQGSPLKEKMNQGILEITNSSKWKNLQRKYF